MHNTLGTRSDSHEEMFCQDLCKKTLLQPDTIMYFYSSIFRCASVREANPSPEHDKQDTEGRQKEDQVVVVYP